MNTSRKSKKNQYRIFFFAFALLLSGSIYLVAQDNSKKIVDNGWGVPDQPFNCEMNSLYMDMLSNTLSEHTKNDKVLIIIARLGKGETPRTINGRRLHNALQYLIDKTKIAGEKIVLAEGSQLENGFGRLEFYLNGKIVGSLLIRKNKDFCVDCCETQDPNYYPQKALIKNKSRKVK